MKTLRTNLITLTLLTAVIPALQGCFPVVAAGAGAGTMMLVDRRPSEVYLADEAAEIRAMNRVNEKFGDKVHINLTSYSLKMLITGEVPDAATKEEVEQLVLAVPNVKGVVNEILVAGNSSFGSRSNDSYITAKVKGRFIEAGKFRSYHVKTVTEGTVVYLLGMVTNKEAEDATELARTTAGVRKVVRAFEIITDADAQRIDHDTPEEKKKRQQQALKNQP